MYELIKKRIWWILFLLAIALIIGITNNLNGQIPTHQTVTADIYKNGTMIMLDSTEICFIYDTSTTFMLSGDTLKVLIRKEK